MGEFYYKYDDYTDEVGILYETDESISVDFVFSEGVCILSANREGLLSLAKSLIKLADSKVPISSHFHLDSPVFMNDGSLDLVIEKKS